MRDKLEREVTGLDRQASLRLRDDPRGFVSPVLERLLLQVSRLSSHERDPGLVEEVSEGGHFVEGAYDPEILEELVESVQPCLDSDSALITEIDGSKSRSAVNSDLVNFRELDGFEQVLEDSPVEDLLRSYFGSEFRYGRPAVLRYEHLPPEIEGRSTRRWHIDYATGFNTVRVLVFLQDDSNPIQVVSEEQTRQLLEDYSMEEIAEKGELVSKEAEFRSFGGDRGDAVVFNARRQLHRGTNPDKGESRMVMSLDARPEIL